MNQRIKTLCAGLLCAAALNAQRVEWVSTTDDSRWQTSNKLKMENALPNTKCDIKITGETAQVIEGFGGCFSEL